MSRSPEPRFMNTVFRRLIPFTSTIKQRASDMIQWRLGKKAELMEENAELKSQNEALQAQVMELKQVDEQNKTLKSKLKKSERINQDMQSKTDSLKEKIERLKQARDQLLVKTRSAPDATGDAFDPTAYNTADSMDAFYADPANVAKYNSQLQISVYDLFLEQLTARVDREVSSVLDAGCGLGLFTGLVADRFPQAAVSGFDFSEQAIQQARSQRPDIEFFLHDIYDPLPQQYALILCTETLEHLTDPSGALRALLSALAPGGSAFFTVPDGRVDQSSRHIQFWSPESWDGFLRRGAGSAAVETGVIQHPDHRGLRYNWGIIFAR